MKPRRKIPTKKMDVPLLSKSGKAQLLTRRLESRIRSNEKLLTQIKKNENFRQWIRKAKAASSKSKPTPEMEKLINETMTDAIGAEFKRRGVKRYKAPTQEFLNALKNHPTELYSLRISAEYAATTYLAANKRKLDPRIPEQKKRLDENTTANEYLAWNAKRIVENLIRLI